MASAWYTTGKQAVLNESVLLLTHTIKVILVTDSYSFSAGHDFANDVSANEISVSGYVGGYNGSGRKSLANKSIITSGGNAYLDADDLTWTSVAAGTTVGGAVLVREVTNDAASPILCFLDPSNISTNGNDITLSFAAAGIAGF